MLRALWESWGKVALIGILLLSCLPAFGQTADFEDGLGTARFDQKIGLGPAQEVLPAPSAVAPGLPFFTRGFNSLGAVTLPMNIVGTDPGAGAATTSVAAVVVPLRIVFANGMVLDGTNVVFQHLNSPIFQSVDFTTGGIDLGVTQYGDAIQRAEFWNLPGFSAAGYHVLLGPPAIAATVTINVPANKGVATTNSLGTVVGRIDDVFFDQLLASLLPAYQASQLPVFVTDNVFEYTGGDPHNCCILGYHASQSGPISTAKTWIYAAYTETGTFIGDVILDVQALSHEVAEWLNDPFVGGPFPGGVNLVPPAVLPGQDGACIINFETGDPLESPPIVFSFTVNGKTYHLQDEVFLPWYLQTIPSFSVNESFTFLGTFFTPARLCGPG
jgi:hypothetical protein